MSASIRPSSRLAGLSLCVSVLLLTACSNDTESPGGAARQMPPPQVWVEEAQPTSVAVVEDYAGRARGAREVEVRARIQGILEERLYNEGEAVQEGEALFRIDRQPAAAAVQSAMAQRQVAEANVRQAEREWNRISSLFKRGAISERERDAALSARELAAASLAVADAGLVQAQLNLDYTEVTAPLSGVTSLEDLPEGSLIQQGTLLTTLVQQDPIHVRFALPEGDAAIQRRARAGMIGTDEEQASLEATLIMVNGQPYERSGKIDFTASSLDPRTGTVTARAVFPNPEYRIVPGQFVRVQIQLQTLDDVFTVPETAVGQGPDGARVFVVNDDNTISSRYLELGTVVDGRQVVLDGLSEGDRVVVSGMISLRDGVQVTVADATDERAE